MNLVYLCILVFYIAVSVAANFTYPQRYDTWYAGTQQNISFDETQYTHNDTVTVFFDEDRSNTLASGFADQGNFSFIVPARALTLAGRKFSHLVAVIRRNYFLWKVYEVPLVVKLPPGDVPQIQEPMSIQGSGYTITNRDTLNNQMPHHKRAENE
ncbi:uncharacterized protein BYT42DRAFT_611035 [Radiomyces spectabilis]|uniref:uncharacterized protein n=1 Tax=Radiomyces spectabilis TaxID=64574 RepID=UPI00222065B1|nr:uncharacterized protein BYT42DRAFT_611035 [Radiomyces spectabilis]KAI8387948.1 hypothetical protein BYT42DRAFT_611035 [Radiomyces spectabilis]